VNDQYSCLSLFPQVKNKVPFPETVEISNSSVEVKANVFNKVKPDKMMKKEYYLILFIYVNILRMTDMFHGSVKRKNRRKSLRSQDQ
jgi:hypothetical protein